MSENKPRALIAFASAMVLIIGAIGVFALNTSSPITEVDYTPNVEMIEMAEETVEMDIYPDMPYSFDYMTEGVQQHLDRDYTYDVIPWELKGGLLFQGIHRPQAGTSIRMRLLQPATVYFFFHSKTDGGYTEIFEQLPGWKKMETAPQYDVNNGDHGLDMTMYELEAQAGTIEIPPTTKDRACFNIVFQSPFGKLAEPGS
ncbi:MAG: hypothetical protein AAF466_14255 [Bacteroidota bacterium]